MDRQLDFISLKPPSADGKQHHTDNDRQRKCHPQANVANLDTSVRVETNEEAEKSSQGLQNAENNSENTHAKLHVSKKTAPWMKPDKEYEYRKNPVVCLHEEIKDFFEFMAPRPEDTFMRSTVVTLIKNVIHQLWPQAKVEVFGSNETMLYLPTSDIDVVVFGKWSRLPLRTLEQELVNRGVAERENITVIDSAKVPIIKVLDKISDVKVDICFNQVGGLQSVNIVKHFLVLYPSMQYLILVLKQFLLQRALNEVFTGGISSFCLIYLVVSFLQMHPRADAVKPAANLGVLLMEFFELYGLNFNYYKVGIRIKEDGSYLPKQRAFNHAPDGLLCLEDPMNSENDIGKASYGAFQVKQSFEHAFLVLKEECLRPTGASILGRIVRVTEEVQQYRQWISANYMPPPGWSNNAAQRSLMLNGLSELTTEQDGNASVRTQRKRPSPVAEREVQISAKNKAKQPLTDIDTHTHASVGQSNSRSKLKRTFARSSDLPMNSETEPQRKKARMKKKVATGNKKTTTGDHKHPVLVVLE